MKRRNGLAISVLVGVVSAAAAVVVLLSLQGRSPHVLRAAGVTHSRASYVSDKRRSVVVLAKRTSAATSTGPVSPVLVKHYAILRRAHVGSASAPAQSEGLPGGMGERWGLKPSEAASITLPDGRQARFIPGSSGGCFSDGAGVGCAAADHLATIGVFSATTSGSVGAVSGAQTWTLTGLVPDGTSLSAVEGNGAVVSVPVTDNAYQVTYSTTSSSPFRELQMHHSSGQVTVISFPSTSAPAWVGHP
jgi:hypothetical protein